MRRSAHTRRTPRTRGARGSTLPELAVTVALMSIVLGTVYSGVARLTNAYQASSHRTTNLNEARVLMGALAKDLRTTTEIDQTLGPLVVAAPNEARFAAYLNTADADAGPNLVDISVDASKELVERVTPPDTASSAPNWTYTCNGTAPAYTSPCPGITKTRLVGRYVANLPAVPIFTYFDLSGSRLPAPPAPWSGSSPQLGGTDAPNVHSVQITLVIRNGAGASGDATLQNQVRFPNLDYQASGGTGS